MFKQILYGLIGVAIGFFLVIKSTWIMKTFGRVRWAEEKLGGAGTDSLWRIVGVMIIILSFILMAGLLQGCLESTLGPLFGQ